MHSEHYVVPADTLDLVAATRAGGARVVAVGTTNVRALESVAAGLASRDPADKTPAEGDTRLFITPGYSFSLVDSLVTTFHLSSEESRVGNECVGQCTYRWSPV